MKLKWYAWNSVVHLKKWWQERAWGGTEHRLWVHSCYRQMHRRRWYTYVPTGCTVGENHAPAMVQAEYWQTQYYSWIFLILSFCPKNCARDIDAKTPPDNVIWNVSKLSNCAAIKWGVYLLISIENWLWSAEMTTSSNSADEISVSVEETEEEEVSTSHGGSYLNLAKMLNNSRMETTLKNGQFL